MRGKAASRERGAVPKPNCSDVRTFIRDGGAAKADGREIRRIFCENGQPYVGNLSRVERYRDQVGPDARASAPHVSRFDVLDQLDQCHDPTVAR